MQCKGAHSFGAVELGTSLSQHQHTFMVDDKSEVARVARRVLSVLASHDETNSPLTPAVRPTPASGMAAEDRIFKSALSRDAASIDQALRCLLNEGHKGSDIAFRVIPNVARHLGKAWENDAISFADVTIGCTRLQSALRQLSDDRPPAPAVPLHLRRNCLVLLPNGAQHTLGAIILAQQLRHAGMHVVQDLAATPQAVWTLAKKQSFDAVFVSASLSETSDMLRPLIEACHTQWTDSKVILGGSFQDYGPEHTAATGVKHVTQDWQEALELCI